MDLRTPSFQFNHGGYYAPVDPRLCNNPGGICFECQSRIDEEDAAVALLLLKSSYTLPEPPRISRPPPEPDVPSPPALVVGWMREPEQSESLASK